MILASLSLVEGGRIADEGIRGVNVVQKSARPSSPDLRVDSYGGQASRRRDTRYASSQLVLQDRESVV